MAEQEEKVAVPVVKEFDKPRIEKAIREILIAIGEDPDRPGLKETPSRVARAFEEVCAGLRSDVREKIKVFEEDATDEMVLVGNIPFYSLCEHHLLPFIGKAHVVYIPKKGRVLGLSKIARIVDHVAARPQLQERVTSEIADLVVEAVDPYGVAVIVDAEHLCMTMRGVKKPGSRTVTSALRGICKTQEKTRQEALALIAQSRD